MATQKELIEQNSFLAAQLLQVQQDLERYYLENLQLLQNSGGEPLIDDPVHRYWLQYHPREFWVNFREEALQENWYEAERQGRWAGPKPITVFTIPPLRPGDYFAEFEIVWVIAPELLELLKCTVGETVVVPRIEYLSPPHGLPLVLGLPFHVMKEAQPRSLDIQLEFPRAMSPQEINGAEDIRRLTACFRSCRIVDARLTSG